MKGRNILFTMLAFGWRSLSQNGSLCFTNRTRGRFKAQLRLGLVNLTQSPLTLLFHITTKSVKSSCMWFGTTGLGTWVVAIFLLLFLMLFLVRARARARTAVCHCPNIMTTH